MLRVFAVREAGINSGVYSFGNNSNNESKNIAYVDAPKTDPCFLDLSADGNYLFTADYSGGSVSVYPITNNSIGDCVMSLKYSGSGPVVKRQASSHIHQIKHIPDSLGLVGEWILATDLGADKIHIIKVDSNNTKTPIKAIADISCPQGSGPRHMELGKDGKTLFCITELSGEILIYNISKNNGVPIISFRDSIIADEFNSCGSADMHIHPSGRFLYTSHRLINDRINIYKVDKDNNLLFLNSIGVANHPRNFMISNCGRFLFVACKNDKCIQVFNITEQGELLTTSSVLFLESDQPSSITQVINK